MLTEFFVVTFEMVCRVDLPSDKDFAVMIVKTKGATDRSVGDKLNGGTMLAIASKLIVYTPKDPDDPSPIHIGFSNVFWDFTNEIVALLEDEKAACNCLDTLTLDQLPPHGRDPQLIKSSRRVVAGIEEDPRVYICREAGWIPYFLQEPMLD